MASKTKKTATAATVITLAQIVEATLDSERTFMHVPESVYAPLAEQGLVVVNAEIKDASGNPAVRATEQGINSVNNPQTNETAAPAAKSNFAVKKGFNSLGITVKRGGRGAETYPFEQLEVDDYFFVPATEDRPNPAKSMASTVSSATARYAVAGEGTKTNRKGNVVQVMNETRKFVVRSGEENGVKGAFVTRTA